MPKDSPNTGNHLQSRKKLLILPGHKIILFRDIMSLPNQQNCCTIYTKLLKHTNKPTLNRQICLTLCHHIKA
uniref:Uncharacterized protein n=1 Tax=Arundo donax TaxID=35708 RepID=A0A0A9LSQ2_ARUDO